MFSGDTGFRVFKLASSKIRAWESDCLGIRLSTQSENVPCLCKVRMSPFG